MTRPTRLVPAATLVAAHRASKVGVARGSRTELSSATAKRQPSTAPSLGTNCAGPDWANAQAPFSRWKYPQYRYAAACAGAAMATPASMTRKKVMAARRTRECGAGRAGFTELDLSRGGAGGRGS